MRYRAFVSSTFEDLKPHRAHVINSLRLAGFVVDPMEDWAADPDEPKQFSQARLDGCDLCVLLVAFRRGCVPDGETRSITQLEYDAAIQQGVDVLPFLLEEKAPWSHEFYELDKDPEIKQWREALAKNHGVEFFSLDPRSIDMTGTLGRWSLLTAVVRGRRVRRSGRERLQVGTSALLYPFATGSPSGVGRDFLRRPSCGVLSAGWSFR